MRRAIFLFAAIGLITSACSHNARFYLQSGNKLAAAGKTDEASIQYRKALLKEPNLGEAWYRLGLVQMHQNKLMEAYDSLNRAVTLMPENDDVKLKLADTCLLNYVTYRGSTLFHNQVASLADQFLAKNPNSFNGLRLKGSLALADGKNEEAVDYLRRANQLKPMNPDVVLSLTQGLIRSGQSEEGEKLGLELVRNEKTFGPIYDVLYRRYTEIKRFGDAEKILKVKTENNPSQASYALDLAYYYARAQRPAEMTSTLQRLLNNPKDFPDARLQVGDFYLRTSKWDAAIGTLEEGARLNPTDAVRYQIRIVNALLAQGKKTDAGQLVALILKDHPNEPEARAARAMMRLESGKPEDIDLAEAEFQALVKDKPKDATLRFHLALALQAKGDLAAAKKELQEAIRQRSDYLPPRLALGTISLRQGKPGDALNYAGEILALDPANARAKLLRALGLTAMARYDDARSQLVQLIKEFPQYRGAQIQLGVVAIAQKKFKDAEAIFGRLRESGENDVWSAAGSVETYVAENQFEKALQLLNEAVKKSPDSVALRMLLASTADRAGRYDLAISQYQHLLSRDPKSAKVCLRLGDEYRRKGDTDGAIAMFRQAQRLAPKDPGAAMLLANTLAMTGRAEQARPEFKHLLELRPDDPFVLNDASFNLAETGGDLDEALRMIQRALRKMPSRPDFADTLGWIYLKKNMTEPALQIFSSLVNRNPANPTFRYHLGAALLQKGDSRGARAALQAALGYKPSRDETGKIHQLLGRAGVG